MANSNWKDCEVLRLINLWGDDVLQSQLEGCKRNKQIYERISKELLVYGVHRSAEQCCEKIKKLKSEYRKVKDGHKVTGNKHNNWKFLEPLDRILADKPSTKPPILVDTLTINSDKNQQQDSSTETLSLTEHSLREELDATEDGLSNDRDSGGDSITDSTKISRPLKRSSKRKGREDRMEKIFSGMMDKLLEAQAENDKKFYELEEKRMRFEQSEKEREERMRKEEREFQLKLFGMMAHSSMGGYGWSPANQEYDYGTSSYTYKS